MIETINESGLIVLENHPENTRVNQLPTQSLADVRQEIDDNLVQLLSDVAFHFDITRSKVGPIKKTLGLSAIDEARELAVLARAETLGKELDLPQGLGSSIMRLVINEVVEEHRVLLGEKNDAS